MVEWDDSATTAEWDYIEEAAWKDSPIKCCTIGWRLASNKRHLTLAASKSEIGQCADRMTIPKKCITKIKVLKES